MNSFLFNQRFIFKGLEDDGPNIQELTDDLEASTLAHAESLGGDAQLTREQIKGMSREEKLDKFATVYSRNHHHINFLENPEAEKLGLRDLFNSEAIRIVYGSQRPDGKSGSAEAIRKPDGHYYDAESDEKIRVYTGDIVAPQTLSELINIENIPLVELAEPEIPLVELADNEEMPKLPLVDLEGNEVSDDKSDESHIASID